MERNHERRRKERMNEFLFHVISAVAQLLLTAPTVILALTLHECAHGYVAYKLGDPTAKSMGRLSLNPLRHLDPIGAFCMLFFHIGWARPVPVNCRYFKDPKRGMALTALAGPVTNLFLSLIGALFYILCRNIGLYIQSPITAAIFSYVILFFYLFHSLNLYLAIFNLIPIPPFDGSRILFVFLPNRYYFGIMRYERYIQIALLILIYFGFAGGFISAVASPLSNLMLKLFDKLFSFIFIY